MFLENRERYVLVEQRLKIIEGVEQKEVLYLLIANLSVNTICKNFYDSSLYHAIVETHSRF